MAQCIKCGGNAGFFLPKYVGIVGPLCNQCCKPLLQGVTALIMKCYGDIPQSEQGLGRIGWIAAAHLQCAEHVHFTFPTNQGNLGHSWEISKARAIECAMEGINCAAIDGNSSADTFFRTIVSRAERLISSKAKKIHDYNKYGWEYECQNSGIRTVAEFAVWKGGITLSDVKTLIVSLPGHEWLIPH